jgi:hypothetical protein
LHDLGKITGNADMHTRLVPNMPPLTYELISKVPSYFMMKIGGLTIPIKIKVIRDLDKVGEKVHFYSSFNNLYPCAIKHD